jgi:iron complex transport system substrate-binding protein
MGSEDSALTFLRENFESNPAWSGLSAVKSGNFRVLPKDLFHYKPNERWDESYEYLAKTVFPELFGER